MPCTLPVEKKTVVCETFALATDRYRGIGRIRGRGVTYQMAEKHRARQSVCKFLQVLRLSW